MNNVSQQRNPITILWNQTNVFHNFELGILTDNLGTQPQSRVDPKYPLVEPPWRLDGRCGVEFPSPINPEMPGLVIRHSYWLTCPFRLFN